MPDLTGEEKKKQNAIRNIRVTALFQILAGIFAFLASFSFLAPLFLSPQAAADFGGVVFMWIFGFLGLGGMFLIFLGISLKRHEKWAFYFSIVLYVVTAAASIFYLNLFGLFFSILFLFCLVNPTARKIFFR